MADRSGDFGGRLRAARERRGTSLRQIANTTKISVAVLEALERNDIARLPGGIFSRAFVRSYAAEIGLDPDQAVEEFLAQFADDPVAAGHVAAPPMEDNEALENQRRLASTFLKVIAISLPLAGVLLYYGTGRRPSNSTVEGPPRSPAPTEPAAASGTLRAPAAASTSPAPPPSSGAAAGALGGTTATAGRQAPGQTAPAAVSAAAARGSSPTSGAATPTSSAPAPTSGASTPTSSGSTSTSGTPRPARSEPATAAAADRRPAAGAAAAVTPPDGTAASPGAITPTEPGGTSQERVIVEINASGPCSVTAIVDGRAVGERLLSAGERQTFEATGDLRLKIGDAAAISWTVNGQPARPLGRAGQVVNLHLTPANAAEYVTNR